jgi:SulP family sulfate permease
VMGASLLALALGVGAGLATLLAAFPLPILAGLLAGAGLLHVALLRDLRGRRAWALALAVGLVGFGWNLAGAVALGLVAWWLPRLVEERVLVRVRRRAAAQEAQRSTL